MMRTHRWKKLMFAASLAVLPACGMEEPNSPEARQLDPMAPTELGQTRAELGLGTQTYALPARGGYGGTPAAVECPANHVAVGIHGTVNTYVTSLGLVCRALNADGTLGASVTVGAAGGTWGSPFSSQCPDGMAIVGFPGHYGWYVDSLGVHCAAPNAWRSSGQVQASVAEVGSSYSGNPFSDVCPSQSVVTRLDVRHGNDLDQEQATCTRLVGPPASCQDIKSANPSAADGQYTLYANGNPAQPWTAWCHGMAGTPTEYLTLTQTGTSNFSQYTAGWASPGTNVRTTYFKLRIDPATLRVNTADQTFSSSTGVLNHSGYGEVRSMPYASAASCDWSPSGVANLDLRGTSFTVAANQFLVEGWNAVGATQYSADAQVVDLTGGGYCGSNSLPGSSNGQLQLVLKPLASCQELKSVNPQAVDGEYTLYVNGNPAQPWTAWCHGMAGTPTEYLTLTQTGTSNFSQYTAGWASPGTNVRTTYFKLRIDPATLRVNTADQTFSSSTGVLNHAGHGEVRSMSYASAASCDWSPSGVANLDLRGTSFTVAANQFLVEGWNAVGATQYSSDARVVDLTGGGYCGSNSLPSSSGGQLTLVYSP